MRKGKVLGRGLFQQCRRATRTQGHRLSVQESDTDITDIYSQQSYNEN